MHLHQFLHILQRPYDSILDSTVDAFPLECLLMLCLRSRFGLHLHISDDGFVCLWKREREGFRWPPHHKIRYTRDKTGRNQQRLHHFGSPCRLIGYGVTEDSKRAEIHYTFMLDCKFRGVQESSLIFNMIPFEMLPSFIFLSM